MPIYQVPQGVTHELIEGEVVVVNLNTGRYFSLQGGAAGAWTALTSGVAASRLMDALEEPRRQQLRQVMELWEREALLRPDPQGKDPGEELPASLAEDIQCEVFNDLEDMLLLDPVHEVDPKGWPVEAGN